MNLLHYFFKQYIPEINFVLRLCPQKVSSFIKKTISKRYGIRSFTLYVNGEKVTQIYKENERIW